MNKKEAIAFIDTYPYFVIGITFHVAFAILFLLGHVWHAVRARNKEAGFDFNAPNPSLVVTD